ncbi:hypothetical protein V1514DRAFT_332047 [Lipomyces japonicus]|uniref:uncharacterized protein n=1 Tax=Lipomyces japonicus TaxID=56871 RepID=UPI0034CE84C2
MASSAGPPLTEENLRVLLHTIEDHHHHRRLPAGRHDQHRQQRLADDSSTGGSDVLSLIDLSDADSSDIFSGISRRHFSAAVREVGAAATTATEASTPEGSVVNFTARQRGARLRDDQRPVQGNRHRRRLENARMLYNPHAVPPQPADFLPSPTYAVRRTDKNLADFVVLQQAKVPEDFSLYDNNFSDKDDRPHVVPRTLKDRVKKGHLTQPFLKSLEDVIREFVLTTITTAATDTNTGSQQFFYEKEVDFEADTERSDSFMRWIVYQIAEYYRVSCYTKVVSNGRRVPCVVLNPAVPATFTEPPRPIWSYV